MRVLVTGAAGFIGHHLCRRLKADGHHVTGVDIADPEYGHDFDVFLHVDLRQALGAARAFDWEGETYDEVYHLAADMGGLGYITGRDAEVMTNNALIDLNTIRYAYGAARRFLYASSAVVYPEYRQMDADNQGLREDDALPAMPSEGGYGWEKLFTEQLCRYYREQFGFETRIARLHNCYGPEGAWDNGKEKAPAAMCRKVAEAKRDGLTSVEVWGDGGQTRSFTYVDDTVEGLIRLMRSDHRGPLNIGSDHLVTINQLARIVAYVAGHDIDIVNVPGPQGVRGRCSDNTLVRQVLDWQPRTSLEDGLRATYAWVEAQVIKSGGVYLADMPGDKPAYVKAVIRG